jgi:hypothetical protein
VATATSRRDGLARANLVLGDARHLAAVQVDVGVYHRGGRSRMVDLGREVAGELAGHAGKRRCLRRLCDAAELDAGQEPELALSR